MKGIHLTFRDASDQMGLHILRLRIWRIVHIAADIEIVIMFLCNLCFVYQTAVFGEIALLGKNKVDLFDIFRAQLILVLALSKFPVGVDEQDLCLRRTSGLFLLQTKTQAGIPVP